MIDQYVGDDGKVKYDLDLLLDGVTYGKIKGELTRLLVKVEKLNTAATKRGKKKGGK